jgi:hypothetical protein
LPSGSSRAETAGKTCSRRHKQHPRALHAALSVGTVPERWTVDVARSLYARTRPGRPCASLPAAGQSIAACASRATARWPSLYTAPIQAAREPPLVTVLILSEVEPAREVVRAPGVPISSVFPWETEFRIKVAAGNSGAPTRAYPVYSRCALVLPKCICAVILTLFDFLSCQAG